MHFVLATLWLGSLMLLACARERIDVADTEVATSSGSVDAAVQPPFPVFDATLASCDVSPSIGRCDPCANGYLVLEDGGPSCDCCP